MGIETTIMALSALASGGGAYQANKAANAQEAAASQSLAQQEKIMTETEAKAAEAEAQAQADITRAKTKAPDLSTMKRLRQRRGMRSATALGSSAGTGYAPTRTTALGGA